MLSYTVPAVTQTEATDYTSAAGVTPQPGPSDLIRGQRYIAARFNGRWLSEWEGDVVSCRPSRHLPPTRCWSARAS